eukprot:gene35299-42771_t
MFVFGGDSVDRGPGDLRILSDLVSLKEQYPTRVFIILGNRDINKLRLPFSLHEATLKRHDPQVYWVRSEHDKAAAKTLVKEGCRDSKMKWILSHTMGAPQSFEFRRQELQVIHNNSPVIPDSMVTQSYLDLLARPEGLLCKYLRYGQISLVLGDVLFLHGAVQDYNHGWLPPSKNRAQGSYEDDCRAWSERINAFQKQEIEDYISHASSYLEPASSSSAIGRGGIWEVGGGYDHPQPGSRLLQYGMGWTADRQLNPSVIYATYLKAGSVEKMGQKAADWLKKAGVRRLVVGHQPHGDAPYILNQHGVTCICADNAYSRNTQWSKRHLDALFGEESQSSDEYLSVAEYTKRKEASEHIHEPHKLHGTRSDVAYTEVLLNFRDGSAPIGEQSGSAVENNSLNIHSLCTAVTPTGADSQAEISVHGSLSDGTRYSYAIPSESAADAILGRELNGGWMVKVPNVSVRGRPGSYHLVSHIEGYNFRNKYVKAEDNV